eukprot:6402694-Prymnesium_polylepis.1
MSSAPAASPSAPSSSAFLARNASTPSKSKWPSIGALVKKFSVLRGRTTARQRGRRVRRRVGQRSGRFDARERSLVARTVDPVRKLRAVLRRAGRRWRPVCRRRPCGSERIEAAGAHQSLKVEENGKPEEAEGQRAHQRERPRERTQQVEHAADVGPCASQGRAALLVAQPARGFTWLPNTHTGLGFELRHGMRVLRARG